MFYSHEVLTSRRYGISTIWLVATLGSKSTLKKVSKRAILDVDVQKACESIVEPEAPMALRLSSNLLYGVTRVYAQQCGYVLADAETARNNMRAIFKVLNKSALEVEGGAKGRTENLILEDDPNFLPDFDLIPLDLEQLNLDVSTAAAEDSQRSTLSPHNSQSIINGSQQLSLPGLNIPARSSSLVGGPVGGYASSFGIRGDSGAGIRARDDDLFIDDGFGITVEPDGTMRFSDAPGSVRQPAGPSERGGDIGNGSAQRGAGAREFDQGGQDAFGHQSALDNDGFLPLPEDDLALDIGAAEAFPPRRDQDQLQQSTTSETADAPARRRPKPAPKVLAVDTTMELRNADLARWNTDYAANMREASRSKHHGRAAALAKENARYWVLGAGADGDFAGVLASLGQGDALVRGPLEMFSGAKLLSALTGVDLLTGKRTRDADVDDDEEEEVRRKRSRGLHPSSDEVGRDGFQHDDGYMIGADDYTGVEQGRNAPTPLNDERNMSSLFPWNQSTGSRRPTGQFTSASLPGAAGGLLSRRGSRLQSASPLVGRGLAGAGIDDLGIGGLYSDVDNGQGDVAMEGLDDFELFGPAAQVDTQTAAQSQWVRTALDNESSNFMGFVQGAIEAADATEHVVEGAEGSIDFETLLPPETNTRIVAAQGLLHVLTLGTRGLLHVEQDEAFGAISMRPAVAI